MRYIDPRGKLLNHLGTLRDIRQGVITPPVNVEIDLSNRCSLGCEWCHFAYTHTRGPLAGKRSKPSENTDGGDLMDASLILSVIEQARDYGVKSITWTGGGEPTLHPNFDDAICWAYNAGIDQGLYTHGGHIDRERAAGMRQYLNWVYVSLDADNPNDYRARKGTDRFASAIKGIEYLVKAEGGATVGVGFLLDSMNYHRAWEMLYLARDLGVDYAQFRPVIRYDMAEPGKFIDDRAWIDAATEMLYALKDEPDAIIDLSRFEMYADWAGHGYSRCWWAELQTVITPNGKVWACVNKRQVAGAEIGDLTVDTFRAIWERHQAVMVDGDCRVMCRGHIPNLSLVDAFENGKHRNFI